jgi:hypothetical protein
LLTGVHDDHFLMSPRRTKSSAVQFACRSIIDFMVLMVNVSPPAWGGDRHAAPVDMGIALVRSDLAEEIKAIAVEGGDEFPRGE